MKNRFKNINFGPKGILLLFIAGALSACNKKILYHSFHTLPVNGWEQRDTLLFNVEVPDSQTYYKLFLEIRNGSNYPYQNINLSVSYGLSDSVASSTDSLECILADKEGVWKGKGWGGLYQSAFPTKNVQINQPGNYFFKIAYILPDTILTGIQDIGIKLEKVAD